MLLFIRYLRAIRVALFGIPVRKIQPCQHSWHEVEKVHVYNGGERPVRIDYIRECMKCGEMKKFSA